MLTSRTYRVQYGGEYRGRIEPVSNLCNLIDQHLFFLRVNAFLTILSLISAYYYYFVTKKTGRGIEITTRRVIYSHGTIHFPQLQGACDRQRKGTCNQSSQEKCKISMIIYGYGILIGKCVECMIITAVTHYGPQTRTNQEFCNHTQDVFVGWGWGWGQSVYYNRKRKLSRQQTAVLFHCWQAFTIQGSVSGMSR